MFAPALHARVGQTGKVLFQTGDRGIRQVRLQVKGGSRYFTRPPLNLDAIALGVWGFEWVESQSTIWSHNLGESVIGVSLHLIRE